MANFSNSSLWSINDSSEPDRILEEGETPATSEAQSLGGYMKFKTWNRNRDKTWKHQALQTHDAFTESITSNATDEHSPERLKAYIKDVPHTIDNQMLRYALSKTSQVSYVDINRRKRCAFVNYPTRRAFLAALDANPHDVLGERLFVEERPLTGEDGYARRETPLRPQISSSSIRSRPSLSSSAYSTPDKGFSLQDFSMGVSSVPFRAKHHASGDISVFHFEQSEQAFTFLGRITAQQTPLYLKEMMRLCADPKYRDEQFRVEARLLEPMIVSLVKMLTNQTNEFVPGHSPKPQSSDRDELTPTTKTFLASQPFTPHKNYTYDDLVSTFNKTDVSQTAHTTPGSTQNLEVLPACEQERTLTRTSPVQLKKSTPAMSLLKHPDDIFDPVPIRQNALKRATDATRLRQKHLDEAQLRESVLGSGKGRIVSTSSVIDNGVAAKTSSSQSPTDPRMMSVQHRVAGTVGDHAMREEYIEHNSGSVAQRPEFRGSSGTSAHELTRFSKHITPLFKAVKRLESHTVPGYAQDQFGWSGGHAAPIHETYATLILRRPIPPFDAMYRSTYEPVSYQRDLEDWWSSGKKDVVKHEALASSILKADKVHLYEDSKMIRESVVSARLLVPVLSRLASYVTIPADKRQAWTGYSQPPESAIDRCEEPKVWRSLFENSSSSEADATIAVGHCGLVGGGVRLPGLD